MTDQKLIRNPYYDPSVLKQTIFPRWYWLFLWMFPTYVSVESPHVVYWKKVFGRIYITGEGKL